MQRKKLGRQGEDVAACYLEKSGYTLLQRNYTCRLGEIDIVALDRDVLVFVEVRSRRSEDYGLAQESVTERKKLETPPTGLAISQGGREDRQKLPF